MSDQLQKLKKRLKSRAGETIGEVLVAVLISALALALLAGMVTATSRMVKKSRDSFTGTGSYVTKEYGLTAPSGAAGTVRMTVGGVPYDFSVTYAGETIGGKTVVSYR